MMKLGKISPLAFSRMKQRGISIDALNHLLAHGQVEKQFDGAQVVYLDSPAPGPTWVGRPAAQAVCGGGCGGRGADGGEAGAVDGGKRRSPLRPLALSPAIFSCRNVPILIHSNDQAHA